MIHVHITAGLQADETGPHEVYTERLRMSEGWASDASEAHAGGARMSGAYARRGCVCAPDTSLKT